MYVPNLYFLEQNPVLHQHIPQIIQILAATVLPMEQQHRQAQRQNQQLTPVILDPKQRQRRELQCPHQITTHTQSKH